MTDILDFDLQQAAKAVNTLLAIAEAIRDPSTMSRLAKAVETAKAERAAADEVIAQAEAAKGKLAETAKASADFADFKERTYAEFRQVRADIAENTAALDRRHASLNDREAAIAAREAAHANELERLRAHVGRAA